MRLKIPKIRPCVYYLLKYESIVFGFSKTHNIIYGHYKL